MTATRRIAPALLAVSILLLPGAAPAALDPAAREAAPPHRELRAIAAWLEESGEEGALGDDVADALGIPRMPAEQRYPARQLAYRSGETLYLAQVLAGGRNEYLLFMVKRGERVVFYLSTLAGELRKTVLSVPRRRLVIPLYGREAESGFRDAVGYWRALLDRR